MELPERCTVICYAADTLLVTIDEQKENTVARSNVVLAMLCQKIRDLSLSMTSVKIKAMTFTRCRNRTLINALIVVKGTLIKVKANIKYLGNRQEVEFCESL